MTLSRRPAAEITNEMRHHLEHGLDHVGHLLPAQGPMTTFVHHNTLHGLQHLPFEEAVAEAGAVFGGRAYLPLEDFRRHYGRGRIDANDVASALRGRFPGDEAEVLARLPGPAPREITRHDVRRIALVHGVDPLDPAALDWQSDEEGAFRRLRSDVPADVKQRLLATAAIELMADLDRVGVDWTLADWIEETLGVALPAAICAEIRGQRRSPVTPGPREVVRWLDALEIPEERRATYLRCIEDQGVVHTHLHALWLQAEARHVARIAAQHFDVRGTVTALSRHLAGDVEAYATQALWSAVLARLGLVDPRSPDGPRRAGDIESPGGRAEALFEQITAQERRGGPPIPLDPGHREQIQAIVQRSLERAAGSASPAVTAAHTGHAVESLCWTIVHEIEPARLYRRGLDALQALISLDERPADHAPLLDALTRADPRRRMLDHCRASLEERLGELGQTRSHRDFLLAMTGEDVNRTVHPYLIRICAAFLDEGLSALPMQGRALGFYDAWRSLAEHDASFALEDLPGCYDTLHDLPALPTDAVIRELVRLGVDEDRWQPYLRRLLVQLPGFSGMARWRQTHPAYPAQKAHPIDLIQLLAVRLFYEGLLVRRLCRTTWNLDGTASGLAHYFRGHVPEFFVRHELFRGALPEFLASRARALTLGPVAREGDDPWLPLAEMIWTYRESGSQDRGAHTVHRSGWRLFHLAQHLGVSAGELRGLPSEEACALLGALDAFPDAAHGPVWQAAYESHYRDEVLGALACKREKGETWRERPREGRPKAQMVFCIDDREEAIRRHIEELDPAYETLSCAGFFGVAIYYRGLGEPEATPLCPIAVTPGHEIVEVPRPGAGPALAAHTRRAHVGAAAREVYRAAARNVLPSYFLIDLLGFFALLPLVGKVLAPRLYAGLARWVARRALPEVATEVAVDHGAGGAGGAVKDAGPHLGFTLAEQADKVAGTLRTVGLLSGFAPLVTLLGHGSVSENNPHLSAYDCGACGGKHGGPNARAFAAMANRREVRAALRERGVEIPDDTWFLGAEHNTADDGITYYDLADLPPSHRDAFARLSADLKAAAAWSAHERCRRFASAPRDPAPLRALKHVIGRTTDFSQARPELGHVTNACCIVGRRAASKGVFLDRRAFLVSYDPTRDAGGKVLEGILLAVGPVGAGINLEYYFSTVDNAVYGCGTKVPHNVTGLIAVMEGAQSDLRTGLPRQMIEIHEPVRLQIIVEAKLETLGAIYGRQPGLQELIGNGWVHLIAMDPETGAFAIFDPKAGFVPWRGPTSELPTVSASPAWYRGKTDFLAPALIRRDPERRGRPSAARRADEVAHA